MTYYVKPKLEDTCQPTNQTASPKFLCPASMPTIQPRQAFGSGSRSVGPPAAARSYGGLPVAPPPTPPPPASTTGRGALGDALSVGFERNGYSKWPKAIPHAPAAAAPSGAPSGAPAAAAPAQSSAVANADWRDAFKVSSGCAKSSSSDWKSSSEWKSEGASKFRAAVEAERWRSKLSGAEPPKKKEIQLEAYHGAEQAGWARERLFGTGRPSATQAEDEELEVRKRRSVGLAWVRDLSAWVDVRMIDQLEETIRRRLGELERTSAHAGRSARAFFAECDPSRSGRVLRAPFVDVMSRKLNYDFASNGPRPSSTSVLAALFDRFDLARAGVIAAEDLHAALVGAPREGRASGRVIHVIGRLREGLERSAGGYDALRAEDSRWYAAQKEDSSLPSGCLPTGVFVEGLMRLAQLAFMPLSDADLNVIADAFEPPGAREGLVSYDEFTYAVRGPPMNLQRVGMVRAAYAALKDDSGSKKEVKPHHLASRYDPAEHPAVVAHMLTEEEAAMAFLYPWKECAEVIDDEVSLKELADRYEWVSPMYGTDADFEAMMRCAWKLR